MHLLNTTHHHHKYSHTVWHRYCLVDRDSFGILSFATFGKVGLPSSIDAAISAPTPNWGQPPSMVTKRFVFFTEVAMHSMSNGLMLRRFITCLPTQNQNDPIKCKLLLDSWDT